METTVMQSSLVSQLSQSAKSNLVHPDPIRRFIVTDTGSASTFAKKTLPFC